MFVVWLADGRFPSAQALRDRDGEEEERRLFYVACTRAKDELALCYPLVVAPRDRERIVLKASRFLEELPGDPPLYERWQLEEEPGALELPAATPAPPLAAAGMPALFGAPQEGDAEEGDTPF